MIVVRVFHTYPAHKDSGVEWLGEVPGHWSIFRLCNTVTDCRNGIWGDEPSTGSADIACIRVADFDRVNGRVVDRKLTVRANAAKQRTGKVLHRGGLLIEKSGGGEQQLVGAVVLFDLDVEAVCSNFVARMPIASGFAPAFLCYLHASLYAGRLNLRSIKQSIGIQNLDSASYLSELAGFPSLDEQSIIATFLDRETTMIDGLVAKKERLIELLQEKRAALVTDAVTKGLDPIFGRGPQGSSAEEMEALSRIIKELNERFGTDFTEEDKVFIRQLEERLANDTALLASMRGNPPDISSTGFSTGSGRD